VLAWKSVWNVETTKVNTIVSGGHGHVVSVANVRTKSHQTCLTIDLFRLDVDLLTIDRSHAQRFGVSVTCLSGTDVDVIFTSPDTMFSTWSCFSPRANEELDGGGGGNAAATPSSPTGAASQLLPHRYRSMPSMSTQQVVFVLQIGMMMMMMMMMNNNIINRRLLCCQLPENDSSVASCAVTNTDLPGLTINL